MSDIIERAEKSITRAEWKRSRGLPRDYPKQILDELVAELKTARAQRDEFHAQLDDALAENERRSTVLSQIHRHRGTAGAASD